MLSDSLGARSEGGRLFQDSSITVSCSIIKGNRLGLIGNLSHMSFRLVPNSMTLDDLERRISPNRRVISPNSVALGADYVKVFEDRPILPAAQM